MSWSRDSRRGARLATRVAMAVLALSAGELQAQRPDPPAAIPDFALSRLVGEWFEMASTGAWSRRRCVADTRFGFSVGRASRSLDVATACSTSRGIERRRGRLRGGKGTGGTLRLRLVPAPFGLLPAVWDDFWVLAVGEGDAWLVVGDRRRQSLTVLSRTVALDEAAFALALARARAQGFDIDRLSRVAHPSGATGLRP